VPLADRPHSACDTRIGELDSPRGEGLHEDRVQRRAAGGRVDHHRSRSQVLDEAVVAQHELLDIGRPRHGQEDDAARPRDLPGSREHRAALDQLVCGRGVEVVDEQGVVVHQAARESGAHRSDADEADLLRHVSPLHVSIPCG
jgi:hypothetical protein